MKLYLIPWAAACLLIRLLLLRRRQAEEQPPLQSQEEEVYIKVQNGQTIVEIVVAIGIALVVIVAVVALSVRSLGNINFARNQTQANRLANEAIEWLRREHDANWDLFLSRVATRCMPTLSWTLLYPPCNLSDTSHQVAPGLWREVNLVPENENTIRAQVSVFWNDSKGLHKVMLDTRFTKWR